MVMGNLTAELMPPEKPLYSPSIGNIHEPEKAVFHDINNRDTVKSQPNLNGLEAGWLFASIFFQAQ